jgi:hypothetical protein
MTATEIRDEIERLHETEVENEPYGSGKYEVDNVIEKLAEKAGISVEQARKHVERYFLN